MKIVSLNGAWSMKALHEQEWTEGMVPGSVYSDFLRNGLMEDPFYRDNEDAAKELAEFDYEYVREFAVNRELLACSRVELVCEGIDTLSDIYVNDKLLAVTNNMHRTYELDVKGLLKVGMNTIRIVLHSPLAYVRKKNGELPLWCPADSIPGFPHLRKAHYMFGWDWGPQLPDLGIWRSIFIRAYSHPRLEDVYITQAHSAGQVELTVRVEHSGGGEGGELAVETRLTAPGGEMEAVEAQAHDGVNRLVIPVSNPMLWWPNGYGSQPLYQVEVCLKQNGVIIDTRRLQIGLRTIRLKREQDQWGESFQFEVNGVSIFAMGANYIPEDNVLARRTPEKTARLLKDCLEANFNCIRVWGGGIYPEDYFFDLCDEYGILVWQDFMFGSAVYELTDEFADNIRLEVRDNIRRIRHHACLGLWCGNNEMEWGWAEWDFPKPPKLRTGYLKHFEILLPEAVKQYDPQTEYWPASPSSGGGFDDPNNENKGDVHFWEVWMNLKPFTDYRKHYFRFVSEFGFQSFPGLKTVESFTLPQDRNIFSHVMEKHQKNGEANGKILFYLAQYLKYPKDFDSLLYASQLLQAEAIKYGVEHWRRNRGRCMGAIYWQINDCWPVASWSSIDSFHRWKALHYYAKKFFSPVLLSANEEGDAVELHLTNETFAPVSGRVVWKLREAGSQIVEQGETEAEVQALSSCLCIKLDFSRQLSRGSNRRALYLEYELLLEDGTCASAGTVLFVRPKHFELKRPEMEWSVAEENGRFQVSLRSKTFAKGVELSLADMDCIFSDNYFDLSAGEVKVVELRKDSLPPAAGLEDIRAAVRVRSLYDIAE